MIRVLIRRGLWLLALLLATEAYAQTAGPTFPNPGKASMSKDNQHALGMEVAAQVFQQMPVLPDYSEESQYIRQLGMLGGDPRDCDHAKETNGSQKRDRITHGLCSRRRVQAHGM